jgi:DNA-binding MarR family transcriptional regulator
VIEPLSEEIPAPPPGMSLDEQLCFALYTASRAMTGCYRPGLDGVGLTYPQYLVMLVLWEHRSVSVNQLSERLQLSTGTLSPLLKRLEAAGLLDRRRRTDDERQVQLTVTERGMALMDRTNVARSAVEAASGMTRPEIARLRDELIELTERLRVAVRSDQPA